MYDLKLLDTFNQERHLGSIHEEFGSYRISEYEGLKRRVAELEETNRQLAALLAEFNEQQGFMERDLLKI